MKKHIKEFLLDLIIHKKLRFVCDCSIHLDVTGIVKNYKVCGDDIIIYVEQDNGKVVPVTFNHPGLYVQDV